MAQHYSPKIVTDGLVLCLDAASRKSYPGSGTAWNDLSGNGYNATLSNSPVYTASRLGGLTFNGTNQYGTLPSTLLGATSDWTLTTWVTIGALLSTQGTEYTILGQYVNAGGNGRVLFGLRYDSAASNNKFGFLFGDRTSPSYSSQFTYSTTTPVVNVPYSVTATRTGNSIRMYVNGVLETTDNYSVTLTLLQTTNTLGYGNVAGTYLNGTIHSIQSYNRALSTAEVSQNFNATRGRFGI